MRVTGPDEAAHWFYVAKGVIALVATVLYLVHMDRVWPTLTSWGRRLRYLALLAGGMVLAYASVEQLSDDSPVNLRNVFAMGFALLLLAAAVVSLNEDRR